MDIPSDLWPLITSFLSDHEKRQMRLTNTKLFNIIKYNNFTLYNTRGDNIPEITARLLKYSWLIKLNFHRPRFTIDQQMLKNLARLTRLTKINADYVSTVQATFDDWMQLSTLTNIESIPFAESYAPLQLLKFFPKLSSFRSADTRDVTEIVQYMSHLNSLEFSLRNIHWCFGPPTIILPIAVLPNPEKLTKLSLGLQYGPTYKGKQMLSSLVNLKDLKYEASYDSDEINIEYLTALVTLHLTTGIMPYLARNTNLKKLHLQCSKWPETNLESICNLIKLSNLHIEASGGIQDLKCLSHLTALTRLAIDDPNHRFGFNLDNISDLSNLKYLSVEHYTGGSSLKMFTNLTSLRIQHWNEHQVNFRAIETLTQLRSLHLSVNQSNSPVTAEISLIGFANLTNLRFNGIIIRSLEHLTNLESITIPFKVHEDETMYFYFVMPLLQKLTDLNIESMMNTDLFWQNIAYLTNLEHLSIRSIDSNERLSQLTGCTKLTMLEIRKASPDYCKNYFSVLTSLKHTWYKN